MSVHSFFRRFARNDDSQLLPTVVVPPHAARVPRPTNVAFHDASHAGTMPPLPLRHPEAFLSLAREERHLRQSLQTSIDAQSEGLLAGFVAASSSPDETSSPGRRTSTSEHVVSRDGRNAVVIPVRQPAPQTLGLQGARREIARGMTQLEGLKAHEEELLEVALAGHEEDLAVAEALGRKREGLEASIRGIETEESSRHVQGLCSEERLLNEEIQDLETKLVGMKARHRHLRAEIEGLDNRVQSQLSSYRAALTLAEKETRNFLARPSTSAQTALASGTRSDQSLWDLPVGRRTLPMAQEQLREEQRRLLKRIAEVDEERTALEEGRQVWADVVREVTSVEQLLRDEMQQFDETPSPSVSTWPLTQPPQGLPPEKSAAATRTTTSTATTKTTTPEGAQGGEQAHRMHAVLQHIDAARKRVKQHQRVSVARRWGLLVCCVGAELEALAQGSAVLRAALGEHTELEGSEGDGLDEEGATEEEDEEEQQQSKATKNQSIKGKGKEEKQPTSQPRTRKTIPSFHDNNTALEAKTQAQAQAESQANNTKDEINLNLNNKNVVIDDDDDNEPPSNLLFLGSRS